MDKIKRLKVTRNIEKYIGNTLALTSAGFIGASIAIKTVSDQSIEVPVILAFTFASGSCLFHIQSKLSDARFVLSKNFETSNEQPKSLKKSLKI